MSQKIAKKLLEEMALIEEAEADGNDRWNTLKGYLEGMSESAPNTGLQSDGYPECGAKFYHAPSCSHFAKNKRVIRRR